MSMTDHTRASGAGGPGVIMGGVVSGRPPDSAGDPTRG